MGKEILERAKKRKNDEFYTLQKDVDSYLGSYSYQFFGGKTVLCNCNDGENSAFVKFFKRNFFQLRLHKLIYITFGSDAKIRVFDGHNVSATMLTEGGGCFTAEVLAVASTCDVIVTNPPFSLFNKFMQVYHLLGKHLILIGPLSAIGYRDIFPMLNFRKLFVDGYVKEFATPDGEVKKFGNIVWWSTVREKFRDDRRIDKGVLFDAEKYPKYENYDGYDCDRISNLPVDFNGVMGVPLTFMLKWNPRQYRIVGFRKGYDGKDLRYFKGGDVHYPYSRILIQRI